MGRWHCRAAEVLWFYRVILMFLKVPDTLERASRTPNVSLERTPQQIKDLPMLWGQDFNRGTKTKIELGQFPDAERDLT